MNTFEMIDETPVLTDGEHMAIYVKNKGWAKGCFFMDSGEYQYDDGFYYATAENALSEAVNYYS